MRGEDGCEGCGGSAARASPPHARGRRAAAVAAYDSKSDHPRMRGEDLAFRKCTGWRGGSPPHARGRRKCIHHECPSWRITPACAGKTQQSWEQSHSEPDHPRMRGEDFHTAFFEGAERGITPACAGKTVGFSFSIRLRIGSPPHARGRRHELTEDEKFYMDHPRMRGEDLHLSLLYQRSLGSPPHARGRLPLNYTDKVTIRITPACAGKTRNCRDWPPSYADHPRMRGEDADAAAIDGMGGGSPPHARGRPTHAARAARAWRITPACAGKTGSFLWKTFTWPDHPRMRGEDQSVVVPALGLGGSPPHARGRPYIRKQFE